MLRVFLFLLPKLLMLSRPGFGIGKYSAHGFVVFFGGGVWLRVAIIQLKAENRGTSGKRPTY